MQIHINLKQRKPIQYKKIKIAFLFRIISPNKTANQSGAKNPGAPPIANYFRFLNSEAQGERCDNPTQTRETQKTIEVRRQVMGGVYCTPPLPPGFPPYI